MSRSAPARPLRQVPERPSRRSGAQSHPRDTAGRAPSRSSSDLTAAFIHDAKTAPRKGLLGTLLRLTPTLRSRQSELTSSARFSSVRVDKLRKVLVAQRWPPSTVGLATSFCDKRSFKFAWADRTFTSDLHLRPRTASGPQSCSPSSPYPFLNRTTKAPHSYTLTTLPSSHSKRTPGA